MAEQPFVGIAGAGYVGTALVPELESAGWSWCALRRSVVAAETQSPWTHGHWLQADLDREEDLLRLGTLGARCWIYLAPAAERRTGADQRLRGFLRALDARPPEHLIYASTTGVYGNQEGALVDENTPVNPESDRGKTRLDAENAVLEAANRWRCQWNILRLPGIYGPGRLRLDAVRAGTPVLCPDLAPPGNRVHRDDIVRAILALLRTHSTVNRAAVGGSVLGGPAVGGAVVAGPVANGSVANEPVVNEPAGNGPTINGIFNLADAEHATSTEFVYAVADALGLPHPPCIDDLETYYQRFPGMGSFLRERRCIDSTRAREILGWEPEYDTIAKGIAASLAKGPK